MTYSTLEEIRNQHVQALAEGIRQARDMHSEIWSEVLLELSDCPQALSRHGRVDAIYRVHDEHHIIRFTVDDTPRLDAQFQVSQCLSAYVGTFRWNDCQILFRRIADVSSIENALHSWLERWLDFEDTSSPDEAGLYGVVHSLTGPDEIDGRTAILVDFGSAPFASFMDLLKVLELAGISEILLDAGTPQSDQ